MTATRRNQTRKDSGSDTVFVFLQQHRGFIVLLWKKRVRKMGRSGQPFDLSPAEDVFHLLRTESKAESHKRAAAEAGLAKHLQGGKAAFGDFLKGFLL